MTGRIVEVQRASLHDGPGLRTTVFFKGCPLHCAWCHNPESISYAKQTLFYPEKCIGCGHCKEGCYAGARVECGKDIDEQELLRQILADRAYYREQGGVTFSGGEPLAQPEFLSRMIDLCRENGIHTAIETSLYLYDEAILRKLDLVMADFKIWNDEAHKEYTGVSNASIREHFEALSKLGVPVIARTPIIPEIEQGIAEISAFLRTLPNVTRYELLPYHPLGNAKRAALGLTPPAFTVPTPQKMEEERKYAFIR